MKVGFFPLATPVRRPPDVPVVSNPPEGSGAHSKNPLSMGNRGLVCFYGQRRAGQRRGNAGVLCRLSKSREDVKTRFEFDELDDNVSFGGKA